MNSQLKPFEEYIISLTDLGVFPSFHKLTKGWVCVLRNGANKQIMPLSNEETCWGETALDALTIAVEGLNRRFSDPQVLRRYIETANPESAELLQDVRTEYAQ